MVFLKSLIFLVYNILAGLMIPVIIRTFLLFPSEEKRIGERKIPLTPGFLYRKRDLLISKLKDTLRNYLNDCKNDSKDSTVNVWENRVFSNVWEKLEPISEVNFLPKVIKENIRYIIALTAYEIAKQFFRTFIPFLLEKFKAHKLINIIEEKLNMKIIAEYYDKFVFKYMIIFFLIINLIIGFGNMILYLIIQ